MPKRSKRKGGRARQRAAAIQQQATTEQERQDMTLDHYVEHVFRKLQPHQIVKEIRHGRSKAIRAFLRFCDIALAERLVQAGLVDAVLDALKDCGTQTIEQAWMKLKIQEGDHSGIAGDMSASNGWIRTLIRTVRILPEPVVPRTCTKIISGLQPLMKCMCHPQKEFFKCHLSWLASLICVADLLALLAWRSESLTELLQQDEIPNFLVQCLCVRICRPDIAEEITSLYASLGCSLAELESVAARALDTLSCIDFDIERNAKTGLILPGVKLERLTRLANIKASFQDMEDKKVYSKTLATCMVDVIAVATNCTYWEELETTEYDKMTLLYSLSLLEKLSNVQHLSSIEIFSFSDAIPKLIALGNCSTVGSDTPACKLGLLLALFNFLSRTLNTLRGPFPVDERYALGVRSGLFEMLLDLEVSYGALDKKLTWKILQGAGATAVACKSNKAIRKQAPKIRAKIEAVLRGGTINRATLETARLIKAILQRVADCECTRGSRSIEESMVTCRWCYIPMPGNDCKQCAECERAFYCSQECQVLDWKHGGHKQQCQHMASIEAQTQQKGASSREIRYAERVVENVKILGNQLFLKSIPQIMAQATLLGFQISECVVEFDFWSIPPIISVRLASDFMKDRFGPTGWDKYPGSVIQRNQEDGALTLVCCYAGYADKTYFVFLSKASHGKPYNLLQNELSQDVLGETDSFDDNPDAQQLLLEEIN